MNQVLADRYHVLCRLNPPQGRGERLWLALDGDVPGGRQLVVIEEIPAVDEILQKISTDVQRAAHLGEPTFSQIFGLERDGDDFLVVRELVAGETLWTLSDRLHQRGGQLSLPIALTVVANAARAVGRAHAMATNGQNQTPLVHGDINPHTIVIDIDGNVRVLDLGIAAHRTLHCQHAGKLSVEQLAYLSPEQCMGNWGDPQSDVFSLGVVLWESLTGRRLFAATDEFDLMEAICDAPIPAPSRYNNKVPPFLDSLVRKALGRPTKKRFPTATKMTRSMDRLLSNLGKNQHPDLSEVIAQTFPNRLSRWQSMQQIAGLDRIDDVRRLAQSMFRESDDSDESAYESTAVLSADRLSRGPSSDTDSPDADPSTQNETQPAAVRPRDEVPQFDGISDDAATREMNTVISTDSSDETASDDDEDRTQVFSPNRETQPQDQQQDDPFGDFSGGDEAGALFSDDEMADLLDHDGLFESVADDTAAAGLGLEADQPDQISRQETAVVEPQDDEETNTYNTEPAASEALESTQLFEVGDRASDPTTQVSQQAAQNARAQAKAERERQAQAEAEAERARQEQAKAEAERARQEQAKAEAERARQEQAKAEAERARQEQAKAEAERARQEQAKAEAERARQEQKDQQQAASDELRETVEDDAATAAELEVDASDFSPTQEVGRPIDSEADSESEPAPAQSSGPEGESQPRHTEPPALFAVLRDDEDEEDPLFLSVDVETIIDDDGDEKLLREDQRAAKPVVEITFSRGDSVLESKTLRGGLFDNKFEPPSKVFSVARKRSNAVIGLSSEPITGYVRRTRSGGEREPLPNDADEVLLNPGDMAVITIDDDTYHIRFFYPPNPPARQTRSEFTKLGLSSLASLSVAAALHVVVLLGSIAVSAQLGVSLVVEDEPESEVFAEGELAELEEPEEPDEPEPEPPEPEPEPEPEPPADPTEQEVMIPQEVREQLDEREQPDDPERDSAEDLMAALSPDGSEDTDSSVSDVVTNIDAVDSTASDAQFRVGGTLDELDGDGPQIAESAGGVGDITRSSGDSEAGRLEARDRPDEVRGRVSNVSALTQVQGSLSRDDIERVIGRHQGRITGCYESALNEDPSLGGQVTFEWTVNADGSVSNAREQTSTLGSATVSNCILGIIRGMNFPDPDGGSSVDISYPFAFQSAH